MQAVQPIGQVEQAIVKFQVPNESLREPRVALIGSTDGAGQGGHGVGVLAGVHGGEQGLLEVLGGGEEAPVDPVGIPEVDKALWGCPPGPVPPNRRTLEPPNS